MENNLTPAKRNYSEQVEQNQEEITREKKLKRSKRYVVFGLGNPGTEFEGTRHNIGFMCIDYICKSYGIYLTRSNSHCLYTDEYPLHDCFVTFAQPQTYMNLSGRAVRALSTSLGILPKRDDRIVIICDDINLPLGTIRLRKKGTSGGQNGLEDILKCLGANSRFLRVRVGVGIPPNVTLLITTAGRPENGKDAARWVTSKFYTWDQDTVTKTMERVKNSIETFLKYGPEKAMNNFNKDLAAFARHEENILKKERALKQIQKKEERKQMRMAKKQQADQTEQTEHEAEQKEKPEPTVFSDSESVMPVSDTLKS